MNINKSRKRAKEYFNFFKNGKVSKIKPFCIFDHPFFISDAKEGNYINMDEISNIKNCKDIFDRLDFSLKILYSFIGEDIEYFINEFTFLSLNEIKNRINKYYYFYDVAIKYIGLGNIITLSYHKNSRKFFLRIDGGINGYEIEKNYNFFKYFDPQKDISNIEIFFDYEVNKLFNFNQFIIINLNNNHVFHQIF